MEDLQEALSRFCSANHLRLNTDLGQHFLVNSDVLESILEAANLSGDDHVVEIGPGVGVLTKELLNHARKVTSIEIDDRMIPLLKKYTGDPDALEVIQNNALHVPFPKEPYKIVANIPYHITSPLLRHAFLESETIPTSLTLLIQKEVAEKICAEDDAGMLTILVQLFGEPTMITAVPPDCFLPPPKVDSAVIHIECYKEPIASKETIEEIFKLTKLAFSQKRKMLSNTIGKQEQGMERLEQANIDPNRRPQTLSIDEWKTLAEVSSA